MADNVQVNAATTSGAVYVTANFSWSGDAANAQGMFQGILTGSEGAWTYDRIAGGAGAVAGGVQRMTLASDDPAVAKLTTIDSDTSALFGCVAGTELQVDVVSSALPTGAATAAKQPALGTAGTASADVITVQGIAAMTALKVDGSAVTQPVSGTVTANAGTNLNTSQLSLESGGNLAAAATSLAILDDWDESDRAKVNLIVGQAGIAAGAGAVGATVPRVTLASDDPAVTALQLIDNAISGAGFNITQFAGAAVPIGAGTEAAALRVTIATDSTGVLSIDDNGGAITVDGTVTANAGTNLNTSALALEAGGNLAAIATDAAAIEVLLGTIDADTSALFGCVDGTELQVDIVSSALPTGAATEATLGDIKTAVQLIDNAISGAGFNITQLAGAAVPIGAGTEAAALRVTIATDSTGVLSIDDNGGAITVDGTVAATQSGTWDIGTVTAVTAISNALPAGSNAIGKLASNTGVDIGDVDVTSIVPGTAATNLGKAEDAGHSSGDVGVMALAVRQNAAAALATTDADYIPLIVDAIGRLHANATDISGVAYDGTTICTVKRFMAVCADGDSLIAAVADKKFRILSFAAISLSGSIARFWLDDADAAVVFGSSTGFAIEEDSGAAPPGFILSHNPHGWFQTATANKALRVQYATGTGACFFGTYIEVA